MLSACEIHIHICRNVLQSINYELRNVYMYEPDNISRICRLLQLRDYYTDELEDFLDEIAQSYD